MTVLFLVYSNSSDECFRVLANALEKRWFARKLANHNTRIENDFPTERIQEIPEEGKSFEDIVDGHHGIFTG